MRDQLITALWKVDTALLNLIETLRPKEPACAEHPDTELIQGICMRCALPGGQEELDEEMLNDVYRQGTVDALTVGRHN